jgi:hypothetical protein
MASMDGEADAAGEYERLRAELADFVLDALAQRIAAGEQPQLSQALVEAIDRRVDEAVSARLAQAQWPDPDGFADSVIAAAAGRGGARAANGESGRPRGPRADELRPRREPLKARGNALKIGLIALVGIAIVAAAAFFLLRGLNGPVTNTVVMNVANGLEPTPDGGAGNVVPAPGNVAAPTSAGAAQNVQAPAP